MRRALVRAAGAGALAVIGLAVASWEPPVDERPLVVITPDGAVNEIVACKTGCAAVTADEEVHLTEEQFHEHVAAVAAEPIGTASLDLETLLFNGPDTRVFLDELGPGPLSAAQLGYLNQELARTTVDVAFRLVDEAGAVRGELSQHIPLKDKQHLVLAGTGDLGHIEIAGKVKRVGLHHLWTRW